MYESQRRLGVGKRATGAMEVLTFRYTEGAQQKNQSTECSNGDRLIRLGTQVITLWVRRFPFHFLNKSQHQRVTTRAKR